MRNCRVWICIREGIIYRRPFVSSLCINRCYIRPEFIYKTRIRLERIRKIDSNERSLPFFFFFLFFDKSTLNLFSFRYSIDRGHQRTCGYVLLNRTCCWSVDWLLCRLFHSTVDSVYIWIAWEWYVKNYF